MEFRDLLFSELCNTSFAEYATDKEDEPIIEAVNLNTHKGELRFAVDDDHETKDDDMHFVTKNYKTVRYCKWY